MLHQNDQFQFVYIPGNNTPTRLIRCPQDWLVFLLVAILLEELLVNQLPQHREHQALQSVSDDLCLQSSAEQSADAVLFDNSPQCLWVADLLSVGLLVHFDHSNRVTAGITDGTRTESDEC